MQVSGNLNGLKKEIEKSYATKLDAFKAEQKEAFEESKKTLLEKHKRSLNRTKMDIEAEEHNVFRTTLSEEKLSAKQEYEQKREELLSDIFDAAQKKAGKAVKSKGYVSLVKKAAAKIKNASFEGSEKSYEKDFPGIVINDKIQGIIVKSDKEIFDFTYPSFIASERSKLRDMLSKELFA